MLSSENLIMVTLFALLVVLGLLLAGRFLARRRAALPRYEPIEPWLSPAEGAFLEVLDQALGADYRVFCKVCLADLVRPRLGLGKGRRQEIQSRIDGRRVDFVICRREGLMVLGAVELEEQSRRRGGARKPADPVSEALSAAQIPLARLAAGRNYGVSELKDLLAESLPLGFGKVAASGDEWQLGQVNPALRKKETDWQLGEAAQADSPSSGAPRPPSPGSVAAGPASRPRCSACGAAMVRRRVARGTRAGMVFWGCANFPDCRTIIPIDQG